MVILNYMRACHHKPIINISLIWMQSARIRKSEVFVCSFLHKNIIINPDLWERGVQPHMRTTWSPPITNTSFHEFWTSSFYYWAKYISFFPYMGGGGDILCPSRNVSRMELHDCRAMWILLSDRPVNHSSFTLFNPINLYTLRELILAGTYFCGYIF